MENSDTPSLGGPSEFPAQPDILSILQWAVKNNLRKEGQYWRIDYSSIAYTDETIVKEFDPSAPEDKDGWITVAQRPDEYKKVLLYFEGLKEMSAGYLINGSWMNEDKKPFWAIPTHWRPLPTAPINPE